MPMHHAGSLVGIPGTQLPIYVVLEQPEASPRFCIADGIPRAVCAYVSLRSRELTIGDVAMKTTQSALCRLWP